MHILHVHCKAYQMYTNEQNTIMTIKVISSWRKALRYRPFYWDVDSLNLVLPKVFCLHQVVPLTKAINKTHCLNILLTEYLVILHSFISKIIVIYLRGFMIINYQPSQTFIVTAGYSFYSTFYASFRSQWLIVNW